MDYADYQIAPYETGNEEIARAEIALYPHEKSAQAPAYNTRQAVVAVVEDGIRFSRELWAICEFLDIGVVRVAGRCDLNAVIRSQNPMAVVCELDAVSQDGCHVMKTVASHDRDLPILLVTGNDPLLIGAADAVEEIWRLTEVTQRASLPGIAGLVDFLFHAGRAGRCLRLMPAKG